MGEGRLHQLAVRGAVVAFIVGMLLACSSGPPPQPDVSPVPPSAPGSLPPAIPQGQTPEHGDDDPLPAAIERTGSRWVPVRWASLPGLDQDELHQAWNALLRSCERPAPAFLALCPELRAHSLSGPDEQRRWLRQKLRPFRIEPRSGTGEGLLTGYYEPMLQASRTRQAGFAVPLYKPPPGLAARRPWYTRQEMETLPQALAALRGQEIAWLADPVDALVLQIQGSGRLMVKEPDGSQRLVRLAFAATNEHPYGSVGRWLIDRGQLRDASWPAIKSWVEQNPQRVQEMLWSNPRTVFFREEALTPLDEASGPKGAQGVALTPGRSIAVDPLSIPYGTPVWLASAGPTLRLQRLVVAQDTGSAIVGAVRADYFTGWGPEAGEIAGRLKQPLQLWALWPR